ncbi:hypothetical protein BT63DRAFT_425439 [Microthyrium microscopicum]|uniref:Zn(2)-C6 fungal-type domain-containing protein n=1 Tax=Microthyrium microscopicum TaxID=703497 RepID=A0A6A6U9K1_9PEZI|nr:hypothetical protein BT63DRAFT_425439 [Microthyrium microscopicum]
MDSIPLLTCERCKRRKIRCDKRNPCSACISLGSTCEIVQRARLPRGRSARAKKTSLDERVARLENLLKQAPSNHSNHTQNMTTVSPELKPVYPSGSRAGEFLAPEFWTTLSNEIAGLRDILDEPDDDQNPLTVSPSEPNDGHPTEKLILFGLNEPLSRESGPSINPVPSERLQSLLLDLYQERVDCLYKLLDWPRVLNSICRPIHEKANGHNSDSLKALEYSIYFMSLCTVTDEEARCLGIKDRTGSVEQYREAAEHAISEARLIQRPNVGLLQAFVIYLLAHRTFYNSATAWTLLAVAVRIGTALQLGQGDSGISNHLDVQLRRRLWYCIALIDTHASFDRGTLPIIHWNDLGPPPLYCNGKDISFDGKHQISTSKFNEMSLFALMVQAMATHKQILSMPNLVENAWPAKLQVLREFESYVIAQYSYDDQNASALQSFTQQAAKGLIASMHLGIRRPPYRQFAGLVPPTDDFDVLKHATFVLEQDIKKKSPEYAAWAWKSWVQWHALAIVLAELSSRPFTEDDEYPYAVAFEAYRRYSRLIADSDNGMLWRPISKLMRRVQQQRANPTPDTMMYNSHASSTIFPEVSEQGNGSFGEALTSNDFTMASQNLWELEHDQAFLPLKSGDNIDAHVNWSEFINSLNEEFTTGSSTNSDLL